MNQFIKIENGHEQLQKLAHKYSQFILKIILNNSTFCTIKCCIPQSDVHLFVYTTRVFIVLHLKKTFIYLFILYYESYTIRRRTGIIKLCTLFTLN